MKRNYLLAFLLFTFSNLFSQEGFKFLTDKEKISIPFKISNNLIIIPVKINDVPLNFLLDTGVENTILFSLEETDSVEFNNIEKIKIRGLGTGNSIDALHSKNNKLQIKEYVDDSHQVFIVLDRNINFSAQLGVTVNGIIGYEFFKNNFVEINYTAKKINVFKNKDFFSKKKLKSYDEIPFSLELDKPYINLKVLLNSKEINAKVLIDSGGSDSIWLFENDQKEIKSPDLYFDDFLGKGFSGDIHGKRSRIEKILIGSYEIHSSTISFPNKESIAKVDFVSGRNGSIGSGILKRFNILFDYKNQKMYIRKNKNFDEPFNYNMSGMEVQHSGVEWLKEEVELKAKFVSSKVLTFQAEPAKVKYNITLIPIYKVSTIRSNSPAALAGIIEGDVILKINGKSAYKYKLDEINHLLQSDEERWVTIEVKRTGYNLKTKFQLKKIL